MGKEEDAYAAVLKKYASLNLPPSLAEFRKHFHMHRKIDRDTFIVDFANSLINDLGGRLEFLYYRTYPGDMSTFNTESNFLRATVGKERIFKLYIETRTVQLRLLNALDNFKLGAGEKVIVDTSAAALKFLGEVLLKEFAEFSKIIIDGWNSKIQGPRETAQPSYIR